jgi:anaerobic glycerol-3-phosphate dehydrogenase
VMKKVVVIGGGFAGFGCSGAVAARGRARSVGF